jgi:hypothetical protein
MLMMIDDVTAVNRNATNVSMGKNIEHLRDQLHGFCPFCACNDEK